MMRWVVLITLLGCASTKSVVVVAPSALKEFDAGMRALRLGGSGSLDRAAERLAEAARLDPKFAEAWHNLGVVRVRQGDDRAATLAFTSALPRSADPAATRLARAESNRRLRRFGDARADYEKVLAERPDDLPVRLRLASLLREAGDFEASIAAAREVLRRKAGDSRANVELGLVYLAAGKQDLAGLVLGKAAEASPRDPLVWNALALLSLAQGRDQEAFAQLDRAVELDPRFRDARFNKASVLMGAGDYPRAGRELEAALSARATDKDTAADLDLLVALGVAYRGQAKYDLAKATWERVLKVAPMHPDALFNLGVLEMDFLENEAGARSFLARFAQSAPDDHPRAKDAQARLKEISTAAPTPTEEKKTP
jgi:tetratricopeptide (TPR) repeat protein